MHGLPKETTFASYCHLGFNRLVYSVLIILMLPKRKHVSHGVFCYLEAPKLWLPPNKNAVPLGCLRRSTQRRAHPAEGRTM